MGSASENRAALTWRGASLAAGRIVAAVVLAVGMLPFAAPPADALTVCADLTSLSHDFTDVSATHPFCGEIAWMADQGISTGYTDGTYRPGTDVTRQAMSAFMARIAGANLPACDTKPFPDVPTDHTFCPEIAWMADQGISTGYTDGTYRPGADVTRQAMSAFMARLADANLPACDTKPFPDVPTNHTFCPEIAWMADQGISTGYTDGTYQPGIDVARQAMSAFMYRLGTCPA